MNNDWKEWKFAGIYCFVNKINGKIYVGQSINVRKRISCHLSKRQNYHFSRALHKYGENNFDVFILEVCSDIAELNLLEQYWIDWLDSYNSGYNSRPIADSNKFVSQKTRNRMRSAHLGKKRTPESIEKGKLSNTGKHLSPETRKKISEKQKGIKNSGYFKRKINQIDSNGNTIRTWNCIKEAADFYGVGIASIVNCCRGISVMSCGFKWRYDNAELSNSVVYKNYIDRRIYQLDRNTNKIIKEWESQAMAVKDTGINGGSISACCKGKRKTAGNYKWSYVDKERLN